MLGVSWRCFLPPKTSYYFFPRSSPLLIGSAYCIAAAVAFSLFPPLPSLPASVGRAAEAARQRCGDGGQCGGGVSSARAMEAAQWRRWRWCRRQAAGRRQRRQQSGSGGGSTATAVAERQRRRQHGNGGGRAATAVAARRRRRQSGGGSTAMAAAALEVRWPEWRRQRGSEAATAGSAATASAARDGSGRDEDNGGDSDGGGHSQHSTKRGSGGDDSGGDGDGGGNSDSDENGDNGGRHTTYQRRSTDIWRGKMSLTKKHFYDAFYGEKVPDNPLRTHRDKPSSIISELSIATMGIFP
jgi:hypothetical protein